MLAAVAVALACSGAGAVFGPAGIENTSEYTVQKWPLPDKARRRLRRSKFNITKTCREPTTVACVARSHNSPGRLSGKFFQHTQQILLPCWSLFRRYDQLKPVLVLDGVPLTLKHAWTEMMIEIMRVEVVTSPVEHCAVVGELVRKTGTGAAGSEVLWLMDASDATELQLRLFGDGASSDRRAPRVGLLNRESHRKWVIISPHGAQLTNLIFARPCTVVVELYPRHYFMPGFYLSLAAQDIRCRFTGYASKDPAKFELTGKRARNKTDRYWFNRKYRYRQVDADADRIAASLPELLLAHRDCLERRPR